jgi:hypothetical protein
MYVDIKDESKAELYLKTIEEKLFSLLRVEEQLGIPLFSRKKYNNTRLKLEKIVDTARQLMQTTFNYMTVACAVAVEEAMSK